MPPRVSQPVILSATVLRYVIFPSISVLSTASPIELRVTSARSRSPSRRLGRNLEGNHVLNGARKRVAIQATFGKIILRAPLHGLLGVFLIFRAH